VLRTALITLTLLALLLVAAPADAATWRTCSYRPRTTQWFPNGNAAGVYMRTSRLRVRAPMNCASGRYAMRKVRRQFRRKGYLPRTFFDGYVRWWGRQVGGVRWNGTAQYHENDSDTAFRFRFHIYSD
jgi:hypothetical protein